MTGSPQTSAPRVAIVLVNWNGWRECIECIDSVLGQVHPYFHLIVVDNDSQDESVERISAWCTAPEADPQWRRHAGVDFYTDQAARQSIAHRIIERPDDGLTAIPAGVSVTLIRSGGNLGFAGGCNVGIRAVASDDFQYFWFLNPDTVVHRDALIELIARASGQQRLGIVGSTLVFYSRPDVVYALGGGHMNPKNAAGSHIGQGSPSSSVPTDAKAVERALSWVCGASMFVSATFINKIGLMNEDYFLYYEEADWATRGAPFFTLGYAPKSIVFHKSGANSSQIMPLFTAGFYYRSRLRFVSRFFPDRMRAAKRQLFVEMLRHVARGRWASARLVGETLLWTPGG